MTLEAMQSKIKKVVYLMLENRGFDHVLGWLYRNTDTAIMNLALDGSGPPPSVAADDRFRGLSGLGKVKLATLANSLDHPTQSGSHIDIAPIKGASCFYTPIHNPHEDFVHVAEQVYEKRFDAIQRTDTPTMKGFVRDYADHFGRPRTDEEIAAYQEQVGEIMRCFTPGQLPVLNGLARSYAVSDMWFSSVPTQTTANRAYSLCGTSLGMCKNDYHARKLSRTLGAVVPTSMSRYVPNGLADDRVVARTIFHVLSEHWKNDQTKDWLMFWHEIFPFRGLSSDCYTRRTLESLGELPGIADRLVKIERFFELAESGGLPTLSYIEPQWTLGHDYPPTFNGNDYHPPNDLSYSEEFLRRVYQALLRNPAQWRETLLIITFDEHGGTYDHYPPPTGCIAPADGSTPEYGFGFDRLGVRVPTILVSPYIAKNTVFRSGKTIDGKPVEFDHTSILATLLKWQGVPAEKWGLYERVAAAPTFEGVFTLDEPRDDPAISVSKGNTNPVVRYGDLFRLRRGQIERGKLRSTPDFVSTAEMGSGASMPQVTIEGSEVTLRFTGGAGPVRCGAVVQVKSSEPYLRDADTLTSVTDHPAWYQANAGDPEQFWRLQIVDTPFDGTELRYGDCVYLFSQGRHREGARFMRLAHSDGRLGVREGHFDFWIVEPPVKMPPPTTARPLQYSSRFRLKDPTTGNYVAKAELGTIQRNYYPTMGTRENATEFQLVATGREGAIGNGALGCLVALNDPTLAKYTYLGAWSEHNCYYYTPSDKYTQLRWKVVLQSTPPDTPITDGARVHIVNQSYSDQELCAEGRYLTTRIASLVPWIVEIVGE